MVTGNRRPPTTSYADLLGTAYEWGRVDGLLAADFEPPDDARWSSVCCRGRDPADFARHLWPVRSIAPPAGFEINAPHCYAGGFEEALTEARADRDRPLSHLSRASTQPATA